MAALSDYLESGLLHHIFRGDSFPKPTGIALALCSGVPPESGNGANYETGGWLPELPSGINGSGTGYSRIDLGDPSTAGNAAWNFNTATLDNGSSGVFSVIWNSGNLTFDTALLDLGWVSGIAITDHAGYGSGNLLMVAALNNPRIVYMGDNLKFDPEALQISFK
jgi:hypothetical protein